MVKQIEHHLSQTKRLKNKLWA